MDPVEVLKATSKCVARLDRAMQLGLRALGMIQWIVLIGVGHSRECCRARLVLVAANPARRDVCHVVVLHQGCHELGESPLIVEEPICIFSIEKLSEQRVLGQ